MRPGLALEEFLLKKGDLWPSFVRNFVMQEGSTPLMTRSFMPSLEFGALEPLLSG